MFTVKGLFCRLAFTVGPTVQLLKTVVGPKPLPGSIHFCPDLGPNARSKLSFSLLLTLAWLGSNSDFLKTRHCLLFSAGSSAVSFFLPSCSSFLLAGCAPSAP